MIKSRMTEHKEEYPRRFYEGQWLWFKHPKAPWQVTDRPRLDLRYMRPHDFMKGCEKAVKGTHMEFVLGRNLEHNARALVWC